MEKCASALGSTLHVEILWQNCIRRPMAWEQKDMGKQAAISLQELHCSSTLCVVKDYILL